MKPRLKKGKTHENKTGFLTQAPQKVQVLEKEGACWRHFAGGAFSRDLASLEDVFWVIVGRIDHFEVGDILKTTTKSLQGTHQQ